MAALLSKAGKDLTVTVLLDALQQTKDFELSMAKKFGASVGLSLSSERRIHFNNFASYKTSSKRRRRHQLDHCSQSVPLSSHTWGYMYSTKTGELFLCSLGLRMLNTFSELLPIFLLPIGVRTPGHPSTQTKVILPRMLQSKQLLSFFRHRLNYSTSTDRHSRVVQRCQQVDRCSTCWKSSKSGFGSMPVRKPSHPIRRCLSIVVSAEEVLMSQMRR
jgi:hypothetical protein